MIFTFQRFYYCVSLDLIFLCINFAGSVCRFKAFKDTPAPARRQGQVEPPSLLHVETWRGKKRFSFGNNRFVSDISAARGAFSARRPVQEEERERFDAPPTKNPPAGGVFHLGLIHITGAEPEWEVRTSDLSAFGLLLVLLLFIKTLTSSDDTHLVVARRNDYLWNEPTKPKCLSVSEAHCCLCPLLHCSNNQKHSDKTRL